ncbi:TetR/AcrR family transcriptional regulator [Nocardioides bruguierae]|uniref:TetR/AcrR family transcriptional regulator n=1 Tax=Nocardioides bruguierae TaxID=2945102 RepID=A0A9X2IGW7_9ACTN|nr:TetR/AcrR family transcriptional regulator [Nocardioides bruguierae]MCM0621999.1 TetR/AcrR family transcriptional regulator [Nocardioides bruguierae]
MPKVSQAHLDARRQQILDAARACFTARGFGRTSMTDVVEASGLSVGAIYRYFTGKEEIVAAICEGSSQVFPDELTTESIAGLLEQIRGRDGARDHARLVAQIYAEAAVSPALAAVVEGQLADLRRDVAAKLSGQDPARAARTAEAFVALCNGYSQQLAVRGDVEPAPYVEALVALVDG